MGPGYITPKNFESQEFHDDQEADMDFGLGSEYSSESEGRKMHIASIQRNDSIFKKIFLFLSNK